MLAVRQFCFFEPVPYEIDGSLSVGRGVGDLPANYSNSSRDKTLAGVWTPYVAAADTRFSGARSAGSVRSSSLSRSERLPLEVIGQTDFGDNMGRAVGREAKPDRWRRLLGGTEGKLQGVVGLHLYQQQEHVLSSGRNLRCVPP